MNTKGKVTPNISGSYANLHLQDQDGNPIQGTYAVSHTSFVPIRPGDTQYLVITNNAWMNHPHPLRVVIVDQVSGGRPMFDIEPHRSIRVPITANYTNQMLVVAVYPIRKREDGEDEAEVGMLYTGRINYESDGGAGPAKRDWVPVGVEPELFALMFRVGEPVKV